MGRHPPEQTPHWADTPLGRHPLDRHPPPIGRHPPLRWETPPSTDTSRGRQPPRRPLNRAVSILLECILVSFCHHLMDHISTKCLNPQDYVLNSSCAGVQQTLPVHFDICRRFSESPVIWRPFRPRDFLRSHIKPFPAASPFLK